MGRRSLIIAGALAPWLMGVGFRYDGTSRTDVTPPALQAEVRWTAPLDAAGLASPVAFGDAVLVTLEPTTLAAISLETGAVLWRAAHPTVDAMPPDARAAAQAEVDALPGLVKALRAKEAELGRLDKSARAGATVSKEARDALVQEVLAGRAKVSRARAFDTPRAGDMLGWAAPTPLVADGRVYAAFANGVVACRGADGALIWQRWLGPPPPDLYGYPGRPSASPLLVDGVLIVGHAKLSGLDAATGELKWTGPDYPHYGTAAVARAGGRAYAISPGGEVVEVQTGATAAKIDGFVWYNGPHAEGDTVWVVGSSTPLPGRVEMALRAGAWRLVPEGEGVRAEALWTVELSHQDRVYASPVRVGDALVAVTRTQQVLVLDAATGALRHQGALATGQDEVWASPVITPDAMWVATFGGALLKVPLGGGWLVSEQRAFEPTTATPLLLDGAIVWRGARTLVRVGG